MAKIIVACAVLHNIAWDRRERMDDAFCDQDVLADRDVDDAVQPLNNNTRQFIVDNYF